MRVGTGFDAHRFDQQKPLVLGGVTIQGTAGLSGHSDADVMTHAIMDALLGAAGLGDLGSHFPEVQTPEGASSVDLLRQVVGLVRKAGYAVVNVDVTLIAEHPVIAVYREEMQKRLAAALEVSPDAVNVKATTTDRLGFAGREEGAMAMAVALVDKAGG